MEKTYPDPETDLSRRYLRVVAQESRDPSALIGGWGVYFTVTAAYLRDFGRDYLFSRDIDLGFHIDPAWGTEQIRHSSFARTVAALTKAGFRGTGFRLQMDFRRDDLSRLSLDESKQLPIFDIASLYVDPMVDYPHPNLREAVGFTPAEEVDLAGLFSSRIPRSLPRFAGRLVVPPREMLLKMKLKSIHGRGEPHKIHKDVADTFALLATYPSGARRLAAMVEDKGLGERFFKRIAALGDADWKVIAGATGVPRPQVETVLSALLARTAPSEGDRAAVRAKLAELLRWGAELLETYEAQKSRHGDTALVGQVGAVLGGEVATALGFSRRTGKKWGRRVMTNRPPWPQSPEYLAIETNANEWLRALEEWARSHGIRPTAGGKLRGSSPLQARYRRIMEASTLRGRIGRGVAFLEWASAQDVLPLAHLE